MSTKEFYWKTAQGLTIYAAEWPVEDAKAVIGLVHGLGEHCRRYDHWANYFNRKGVAMVGCDHLGHGRSGSKKGYAASFSHFYDEISSLVIECERRYPDRPVFLYGHSLGGNLALNYLVRRNPNLAGVILSAPGIQLGFRPSPVAIFAGKLTRGIWPTFTQKNQLPLEYLCRDPKVIEAYLADPLVHDKITARTGLDALEAGDYLHAYTGETSMPLLLMHGTEDRFTSFDATRAFAERVTGPDITFKAWEGLYHELHNEPEKEAVFEYVWDWLKPRIESTDSTRKLKSV